jgi:hypothetical protein
VRAFRCALKDCRGTGEADEAGGTAPVWEQFGRMLPKIRLRAIMANSGI